MPALVNGIAGACSAADIVGICLPSVATIREAFEEEFLPSVREGQIVGDFLTSDPGLAREMSERAAERAAAAVDAPMLRRLAR